MKNTRFDVMPAEGMRIQISPVIDRPFEATYEEWSESSGDPHRITAHCWRGRDGSIRNEYSQYLGPLGTIRLASIQNSARRATVVLDLTHQCVIAEMTWPEKNESEVEYSSKGWRFFGEDHPEIEANEEVSGLECEVCKTPSGSTIWWSELLQIPLQMRSVEPNGKSTLARVTDVEVKNVNQIHFDPPVHFSRNPAVLLFRRAFHWLYKN